MSSAGTAKIAIEKALESLRQGRMIVLTDHEDRENEGDLVFAAEKATPELVNFMARFGRGLICLSMAPEEIDRLGLRLMASEAENRSSFRTAFTVSIEAATGVTTGISVADRCRTIQVATDPKSGPLDIAVPGHIFPLRAKPGGVLERGGQTEGSVDLARLAGLRPAAVICEVLNDDGTMARRKDLIPFCEKHGLDLISIEQLIEYRLQIEGPARGAKMQTSEGIYASHPR